MKLKDAALAKLDLDEDLRATIEEARRITSPIARRRAERALAGALRRVDLGEIEQQLARAETASGADARLFHLAETWRARLIAEGAAAAAAFPGGSDPALLDLIDRARREHDTGKPPGSARALFRHVLAALQKNSAG